MEELILIRKNKEVVTSSRKVAKVFDKTHNHVKRDIRNLINKLEYTQSSTNLFYKSQYKDTMNRTQEEYLMNRDGFTLLAMGFTGKKATQWKLKYIEAFNKMEKALKKQQPSSYMITDPIERAKAWIEEEKERQLLAKEV